MAEPRAGRAAGVDATPDSRATGAGGAGRCGSAAGPTLGDRAREDALAWAAHLRSVRSAVCSQLSAGSADLAEVMAARHDDAVGAVFLLGVLESLPGARKVDTRRRLAELGLSGAMPLAELDDAAVGLVVSNFPLGSRA
jgi:hypothetical protein